MVQDVYTSLWQPGPDRRPVHVSLSDWADHLLVLPATANVLGKAVSGVADDLASTMILASSASVAFAPAMNVVMWNSPAVRRNVRQLVADGYRFIEPQRCPSTSSPTAVKVGVSPTPRQVLTHLADVARVWSGH
jgi:phosphopantothenoylcysteine decarboxylase / phosphopantothenate---cysteine ligase